MMKKVGNFRVYCNGRIFVGPDWKWFLRSFILILVPSSMYLTVIAYDMGTEIFIISFFLALFNLVMLGLTGLTNPGVIPRGPASSGPNTRLGPSARTKDYKINGYTISTKYCTTCQIYRVPRCSHCAMSDNCVEKFDHYCPWVGTCIARRNYRFFLMFVFSGTALCLLVCTTSLSRLVEPDMTNTKKSIAILLVIYTFGAVWFVGGLSIFHIYLVLTNQTTYEHIRRRFGQHGNPYDKGLFMNVFEACCQPNPPYDWDSDRSPAETTQEYTSRAVQLPVGVVLNPTIIAMQQAAREQANRLQLSSNHRASETGLCSTAFTRERPPSLHEYQDSLYSSSSSVDVRQPAMTGQAFTQRNSLFVAKKTSLEEGQSRPERTQDEIQEERSEISSTRGPSLDGRTSFRQDAEDSGPRMLSAASMPPPSRTEYALRTSSIEKRSSSRQTPVRGDSANTSISRFSEGEAAVAKSAYKKASNTSLNYADEPGYVDCTQLELSTLSSLTSNATSEVSSHKTEASELHSRKQDRHRKHRNRVMSMQEIMSSQRSIPDLDIGRRRSLRSEPRRESTTDLSSRQRRFGSDGLARLRSSGETMINNIRSMIKNHSRELKDPPASTDRGDAADSVFVVIHDQPAQIADQDKTTHATTSALERPTDGVVETERDEGHSLRAWVPQLTPISQQKYSELKEAPPSPFGESANEYTASREISTNSASSTNNSTREYLSNASLRPKQAQFPRAGCGGDEDTLL